MIAGNTTGTFNNSFDKDLGTVQTIYTVLLVLGFRQLGDTVFGLVTMKFDSCRLHWALAAAVVALALLGLRLFWAVSNIRRFAEHATDKAKQTKQKKPEDVAVMITIIHLPILLIQAMAFYFLCKLFSPLNDNNMQEYVNTYGALFVYLYCGLLLINALWLMILLRNRDNRDPEQTWIAI
jgi:heme/copper-type cytochrome/quinol oxidase subunit 2